MDAALEVIGQWGPFGGLCGLVIFAFFRRWIVTWGTLKLIVAGKDETIALYKAQAEANAQARDVATAALTKMTAELPPALKALADSKASAS